MSTFGSSKAAVGEGEGAGVAVGLVVIAGLSGADGAGAGVGVAAGFFAAVGALGLGASFFAAGGLAGGCAAGGVSEICAVAPAIVISKPASSDMGRSSFISGVIRARPCQGRFWLFRKLLGALPRSPARHRSARPWRRAGRPR